MGKGRARVLLPTALLPERSCATSLRPLFNIVSHPRTTDEMGSELGLEQRHIELVSLSGPGPAQGGGAGLALLSCMTLGLHMRVGLFDFVTPSLTSAGHQFLVLC